MVAKAIEHLAAQEALRVVGEHKDAEAMLWGCLGEIDIPIEEKRGQALLPAPEFRRKESHRLSHKASVEDWRMPPLQRMSDVPPWRTLREP